MSRAVNADNSWKLKVPAAPPQLEDARLLTYRHPFEKPALAISVVLIVALLVGAFLFEQKEIALGLVAAWLSMIVVSIQAVTFNTLRGAEVTPTQFPAIYRSVEELRRRFQAPPTKVFVIESPFPEAHAFGFRAPYVIVLHSALVDALDPDELCVVLGQQLGQICFGHTRTAILLGGDETSLPIFLSWLAALRDLLFTWYRRVKIMSADRAGVLACGSVRTASRTQVKLAVGPTLIAEAHPDELIAQAFRVSQGSSRVQATLIQLQSPTPPLIHRLRALVAWGGLPEPVEQEQHA